MFCFFEKNLRVWVLMIGFIYHWFCEFVGVSYLTSVSSTKNSKWWQIQKTLSTLFFHMTYIHLFSGSKYLVTSLFYFHLCFRSSYFLPQQKSRLLSISNSAFTYFPRMFFLKDKYGKNLQWFHIYLFFFSGWIKSELLCIIYRAFRNLFPFFVQLQMTTSPFSAAILNVFTVV